MWFDVLNLIVIAFSSAISCCRGLIRELLGLSGILASVLLFMRYHDLFSADFQLHFNEQLSSLFSAVTVLIILLISFNIIASWTASLFGDLRFTIMDRFGGIVLGGAKGVIFCYLIFILVRFFYETGGIEGLDQKEHQESEKSHKLHKSYNKSKDADSKNSDVPEFMKESYTYGILENLESNFFGSFNSYIASEFSNVITNYEKNHKSNKSEGNQEE